MISSLGSLATGNGTVAANAQQPSLLLTALHGWALAPDVMNAGPTALHLNPSGITSPLYATMYPSSQQATPGVAPSAGTPARDEAQPLSVAG